MKTGYAFFVAVGLVVLTHTRVMAQSGAGGSQDASSFGWLFSLDDGKAQARQSGKPLMVVLRCVP